MIRSKAGPGPRRESELKCSPYQTRPYQFLEAHASLVLALSLTPSVFCLLSVCLSSVCHTFPEFAVRSICDGYFQDNMVPVDPS